MTMTAGRWLFPVSYVVFLLLGATMVWRLP
jgi:hypothetical protein